MNTSQQCNPGAAYVSGVLRASRRTRVDDFDCTRTQGTCRTLRHVVSKRRRETASRNAQQSTRKYTCTRCAHGTTQILQVRTIHPRPCKTVISVFSSVHRATVLFYLMLQEIIEQMTAAAKKRQIEIPIGCGSLAKCTARSYVLPLPATPLIVVTTETVHFSIASRADPYTKACHHALRRLRPRRARHPPRPPCAL